MNSLDGLDGGAGNTHSAPKLSKSQVPLRKIHFFTINNYTTKFLDGLLDYFNNKSLKYQIQEETGENGTPHLQGVVMFSKELRSTCWDPKSLGHYEKLIGKWEDAVIYCSKFETRTGKQFSKGLPKPIKIIENLYEWQKQIETIYLGEPDDRKIYWFWENKGNIGKSAFVKYMVVKYKCLFCDGGKKADLINLVFNNDMDECKCVIWDLPRSSKGSISYASLEAIKNGMVCNTKYETGVKFFNSPHIFVFANFPPDKPEELSDDRWEIKCLD